jgi:hypothetical protein
MVKLTLLSVTTPPVLVVLVGTITGVSNWSGVAEAGILHAESANIIMIMPNAKIFGFIEILSSVDFTTMWRISR